MATLPLRPASRRLFWWFVATTVLLTLALTCVGWVMVGQDRELEEQRTQTQRERAADAAVAALGRTLAEFEDVLSTASAASQGPRDPMGPQAAFITFDATGVVARAGLALPYYPAVPPAVAPDPELFVLADNLEHARADAAGAIQALGSLARSPDPIVRGEAWLRLARNYRKTGHIDRAIEAFRQLQALGDQRVQNMPAGLMGRTGLAMLLKDAGRARDLTEEADRLRHDLDGGAWLLTSAQYELSVRQVDAWVEHAPAKTVDTDRAALVSAAESVWRDWRASEGSRRGVRRRSTEWSGDRSVLALTLETPGALSVMLVSAAVVNSAWATNLRSVVQYPDLRFALTDADGRVAAGLVDGNSSLQSIRASAVTKLPWTVHAISPAVARPALLSNRSRLVLVGIVLMVLVVVVSGYAVNRAVSREMRVAALQSEFVAAVSHEFRTPLTTIRQFAEMLVRDRVSTDGRRQQFYGAILSESNRLHRLIEALLDFGRMEAGRFQYRMEPVDLRDVVSDAITGVQHDASNNGYRFDVDGPDRLPCVQGDRQALSHVFRNLLDNAMKYSPEHRTVRVSLTNGHGRVTVSIIDRGLGIPVAEQNEIFQRFVRGAAATTARVKGTGIGLAMAREIVEAHKGTITLTSAPGEGSNFTVSLPVATS